MLKYFKQVFAILCVTMASTSINEVMARPSLTANTQTLATVLTNTKATTNSSITAPKLDTLIIDYKNIISMTNNADIREKTDYRLAQLLTLRAENQQELGVPFPPDSQGYYDEAINVFNRWLIDYPQSTLKKNVMYELAKVYELHGETQLSFNVITELITQFPSTNYAQELHFRRGEYLFSKQNYSLAAKAYEKVIAGNDESQSPVFFHTALYMAGWSYYKLNDPQQALAYFIQVLDQNLPEMVNYNLAIDKLPTINKQLITDAFDVMNLIFLNAQGITSLSNYYQSLGGRYFEYLHYDLMAQYFLKNKMFRDSAQVYDLFVRHYPAHLLAPQYAINKVEIFEQGRFPTLAKIEKEKYIASYGIDGPYWLTWNVKRQQKFSPFLREYLSEIATDQYRIAQNSKDKTKKIKLFTKAAETLLQYQRTFNDDAELAFLYAESLYASQQWQTAIEAYNKFAYSTEQDFKRDDKQRANAAYAALITFGELSPNGLMPKPSVDELGKVTLSEHETNTVRFIKHFKNDKRAISLLLNLMNHRFSQARYAQAIEVADNVLTWSKKIDDKDINNARLIKAHSVYNQGHYQLAIAEYESVLKSLSKNDSRLTVINNNFAASLFKYAQQLGDENKLEQAVGYYQLILTKTPNSPVTKLAHHNSAQFLYRLERFEEAIEQLVAFKAKYPNDILAKNIDVQLASIYEQQKDWSKAASQRLFVANQMQESEAQQQALYLTATFYEKAQDEANALKTYRRHANTYQQPYDRYFEVMKKITEKYLVINKARKYRFWLKKIIKTHDKSGANATPRSTYLAAESALVFASDAKKQFDKIKLNLPLSRSLKAKKASLSKTLTAYKKVADYHVASFTTQSTFETAQVYRQLAQDLMNSQRPKGLDDLALEQYDILLEEQAFPFEDQAIVLYENNAKLSWQGLFDPWIEKSFERLSTLLPGRYNKTEKVHGDVNVIY